MQIVFSPKSIALCFTLPVVVLLTRAQSVAPTTFRFEHLTVDQGLSHSDGMAVAQDQAGFIWMGTNRGLDRYDGYELKHYSLPMDPRNGISGNRIKALYVAPNGRLWVGTERAGLRFYDANHDTFVGLDERQIPAAYRPLARQMAQARPT